MLTVFLILAAVVLILYYIVKPDSLKIKIPLSIATVPLIILGAFLLLGLFDLKAVVDAVIGSVQTIQPWKVLLIFFGAALVSLSADKSGLFEHISSKILNKGQGRGKLLFALTFFLSWFLAIFTSNDIVILVVTLIIFYFSIYSNINVVPLLFASLVAANNGILLVTDNPADIILAQSLGLDQISFIKATFLPSIAALLISFGLLYFYFKDKITTTYIQKDFVKPVRNWIDAKLSFILLLIFIAGVVTAEKINLSIWAITLIMVILFAIKDILIAYLSPNKLFETAHGKLWRLYQTFHAMPWELLPFMIVMFTFVNILNNYGIFNQFSSFLSSTVNTKFGASFVFGFLSLFLDNVINNHSASLLLANIFQNPFLNLSPAFMKIGGVAVILATAIGGSLTLIGSLGALMWKKILGEKGIVVSYKEFAKVGFSVIPLSMIGAFLVLAIM